MHFVVENFPIHNDAAAVSMFFSKVVMPLPDWSWGWRNLFCSIGVFVVVFSGQFVYVPLCTISPLW